MLLIEGLLRSVLEYLMLYSVNGLLYLGLSSRPLNSYLLSTWSLIFFFI